jgi:hypothetical protein
MTPEGQRNHALAVLRDNLTPSRYLRPATEVKVECDLSKESRVVIISDLEHYHFKHQKEQLARYVPEPRWMFTIPNTDRLWGRLVWWFIRRYLNPALTVERMRGRTPRRGYKWRSWDHDLARHRARRLAVYMKVRGAK